MTARIMIVEDEGIVALELEHSLREMGYEVCAITDKGEEALTLAGKLKPDLILMDIKLKGPLSGIEAAKFIREKQDIAVIYLTAHGDLDSATKAKVTEPYAYILKPYEERVLQTTLEIALYKHQAELKEKALRAELERSRRLESLGVLAGGIAHAFNNMLSGVVGNLELAIIEINNGGNGLELIENALASTDTGKILARQLLTFARGGKPLTLKVEIATLLEGHDLLQTGQPVKISRELPPGLWPVLGDKDQLSQAVSNLLTNAVQASPQNEEVTIKAQNLELKEAEVVGCAAGPYVKLAIIDRGAGISTENLSKIFDPYFTTKRDGSGLGLTIVYSIIKNHGGHIETWSEVGKGSVFSIYLPATPVINAAPEIASKKSEPALEVQLPLPAKKLRILVMDDDSMVRITLGMLLESLDHQVELAEKGEEAIRLYEQALEKNQPFDVVILDLTVKLGMGGKETIERLLQLDPQVKAIVSSGYSDDAVIANYQDYGFKEVLRKPYGLKQLETVLKNCLA